MQTQTPKYRGALPQEQNRGALPGWAPQMDEGGLRAELTEPTASQKWPKDPKCTQSETTEKSLVKLSNQHV